MGEMGLGQNYQYNYRGSQYDAAGVFSGSLVTVGITNNSWSADADDFAYVNM